MPFDRVEDAIADIRQGRMVIVADDEDRENEGDLVMAASMVTPDHINFMATNGRGLICVAMTNERADELARQTQEAQRALADLRHQLAERDEESRSREGAFGSFTQADLVPRAGTRQQEATDLLVGTFGTTRARARLATTSCALLFGLGEAPVTGEAEPHEGFRAFEPREGCDAWLRLCLDRAFVEDAPPLVGACEAGALFDAFPAPSVCVQVERTGTERRVAVRWSARP